MTNKNLPFLTMILLAAVGFLLFSNPLQKGGVLFIHSAFFILIPFFLAYFYNIQSSSKNRFKFILLVFLVGLLSLVVSSQLNNEYVILTHADRTWELWEKPHRIKSNMVFFVTAVFSVITCSHLLAWFFEKIQSLQKKNV